ncbi:DUF6881 domain-containing protein [Burkholderia cepacia]
MSRLNKEPISSLDEIANGERFKPAEMDRDEFERIWNSVRSGS